ncbi:MAG TPA: F0F1 ATP synthase subunit alpha [Verrucomicrobiae bacterium]|nr:F0F1 ATP synthase subunit alpha [Verrucomicrobiae bacterium]
MREVGRVTTVKEFIVEAEGLPSCLNGQKVEFENGDVGMVMGFSESKVKILGFGNKSELHAGDQVYSRGEPFHTPVGDAFLGRIITSLGKPFDEREAPQADNSFPIFKDAPGVMDRKPLSDPLETGLRIIDAAFPLAKGQRQLIIGDQMTGKTSIITDTILNQKGKNVICIYCAIGQSRSSFLKVLRLLREKGAMDYTVVYAGIASVPLGEQYLAPYSACALAEYFASKGRDVFVAFDDLGKHAWAYRQLSLLLQRSPGREAYPGDIFYIHSQLLERAGKFVSDLGGGTISFFPVVATIQGDITGYIQTNLISITDGQIYLNTNLFQKGFRPAIDFGLSVSRIGNRAQTEALREMSGKLRLEYLQFQELQRMTTMKADLSDSAEQRLRRGELMNQLFVQPNTKPSPLAEQLLFLYGLRSGILEQKPQDWLRFRDNVFAWMRQHYPGILEEIGAKKKWDDALKQNVDEAFKRFFSPGGAA